MEKEHSRVDPDRAVASAGQAARSPHSTGLLILGWCLLAIYLAVTFAIVEGREPAWVDELYVQSTAWSIVHGGPAGMSVNGLYPDNITVLRFFGPVSFYAGIALQKIVGLKVLPWRAFCFLLGISFMTLSSLLLLRLAGARRWILLGEAAVAVVSSAYCILLPGRFDPVTVSLILAGAALLLYAVNGPWARLAWQGVAAGILFGLAAGSTPRALPPLLAVGCGMLAGAFVDAGRRSRFLGAGIVAAVSGFATDAMLLAPIGLTPWSWLLLVRSTTQGDKVDASPLLGGEFDFWPATHKTVIAVSTLLLLVGVICACAPRRGPSDAPRTWRIALAVMALVNVAVSSILISRFFGYAIFWLPLLVVASFSWIEWKSLGGQGIRLLIASLVGLELLLPAAMEIQRMHTALRLWKGRAPRLLLAEIRQNIPPGSIVFGQTSRYFFAVEQSGSRYLYLADDITPGLAQGDNSQTYHARALDAAACDAPAFAIWPRDPVEYPVPDEVVEHQKILLLAAEGVGTEAPVIYRLIPPADCSAIPFNLYKMRPFGGG
ncbi:MAG: hypothetical protein ACLQG3_12035 [Terracidiphilus sp.]